jgi:hypothetical protein
VKQEISKPLRDSTDNNRLADKIFDSNENQIPKNSELYAWPNAYREDKESYKSTISNRIALEKSTNEYLNKVFDNAEHKESDHGKLSFQL